MQSLKIDQNSEILQKLAEIEAICTENDFSQAKVQELYQIVYFCNIWIDKNKDQLDLETCFQMIEFLYFFDKEKQFSKLFNDFRLSFLINVNKAFFIDQMKFNRIKTEQNSYEHLQRALKIIKEAKENLIETNYQETMEGIKLEFTIIKIYLQLIHSLMEHDLNQKAWKASKKCLDHFYSLINILNNLLSKKGRGFSEEKMLTEMTAVSPRLFEIFQGFLKQISESNHAIQNLMNAFQQKNSSFLQDQANFDKLSQGIGKVHADKLAPMWIDKISIHNFFLIEYILWDKLNQPIGIEDVYTDIFLSLLVMIASILYFQISKANRNSFVEKYKKITTQGANKVKPIFEQNILSQISKSREFLFSKELHALSLQILKEHFSDNNVARFLQKNYKKYYQENRELEEIKEEVEDLNQSNSNPKLTTQRNSMLEFQFGALHQSNLY